MLTQRFSFKFLNSSISCQFNNFYATNMVTQITAFTGTSFLLLSVKPSKNQISYLIFLQCGRKSLTEELILIYCDMSFLFFHNLRMIIFSSLVVYDIAVETQIPDFVLPTAGFSQNLTFVIYESNISSEYLFF